MNILLIGGAGHIGTVPIGPLVAQGHQLIVLDNLKQGHRLAVVPEATFTQADLVDKKP